jgi:hypothetical protein
MNNPEENDYYLTMVIELRVRAAEGTVTTQDANAAANAIQTLMDQLNEAIQQRDEIRIMYINSIVPNRQNITLCRNVAAREFGQTWADVNYPPGKKSPEEK